MHWRFWSYSLKNLNKLEETARKKPQFSEKERLPLTWFLSFPLKMSMVALKMFMCTEKQRLICSPWSKKELLVMYEQILGVLKGWPQLFSINKWQFADSKCCVALNGESPMPQTVGCCGAGRVAEEVECLWTWATEQVGCQFLSLSMQTICPCLHFVLHLKFVN